jgi:hypothetical protein
MRHAGVCVKRQYAAFACIANGGEKCNAFFEKLVRRGIAVAAPCLHNRAQLYHVHHKAECFMAGGAAGGSATWAECAFAAPVAIKRFGLNRYSVATMEIESAMGVRRATRAGWTRCGDETPAVRLVCVGGSAAHGSVVGRHAGAPVILSAHQEREVRDGSRQTGPG